MKTETNMIITAGICIVLLLMSCSQKGQQQAQPNSQPISYKDSTYLEIEGNLNEPQIIWGSVNVYMQAFNRVMRHSKIENNKIVLEFSSAEEINVSTNIYDYIKKAFEEMNINAEKNHLELIRKDDAYIYGPETKTDEGPYPQSKIVLKKDSHLQNYIDLNTIVSRGIKGNLGNIIDFAQSDMKGNGSGDASIYGNIDVVYYLGPHLKPYSNTGYYCCNACAFQVSPTCKFNDMIGYSSDYSDPFTSYTKLINQSQLPLISIRNEVFAEMIMHKGYAQPSF